MVLMKFKNQTRVFLSEEISKFSRAYEHSTIILTTRAQESLPSLYKSTIFKFSTLKKKRD